MNPAATKIVIADDHALIRDGLKRMFEFQYPGELEFTGAAANGEDLLQIVDAQKPDIVITDIQMPSINGPRACKLIKEKYPAINVIAFSMFTDIDSVMGMIQAGANGYLVKTSEKEEIIEAVRTVSTGQHYYCSTISDKLFGTRLNSQAAKQKNRKIEFSDQEKKIMQLICRQRSTKEIACSLNIAVRTVENHRYHLLEKTGARNMVGLALFAVINDLVRFSELL